MEELNVFMLLVDQVTKNPLVMLFVVQWGLGWYLKNKTPLQNNVIPLILFATGGVLGYFTLGFTAIQNVLVGLIVTMLQIGAFESFKSMVKLNR